MKADGDFPRTGASAFTLGARLRKDLFESEDGTVRPGTGGISVAPDNPAFLAPFALRQLREGSLVLFAIATSELGQNLAFRRDPDSPESHGFIEPSRPTTFEAYQDAL
jgi:hypothetical protein